MLLLKIPQLIAIFYAVYILSPVIIHTLMFAVFKFVII